MSHFSRFTATAKMARVSAASQDGVSQNAKNKWDGEKLIHRMT
jgi:hypothetical protein